MRLRNFACFLFAAAALGQVAVQGPQSVYEGQHVAEIDLVANPHRDVEPLRRLLVQVQGQPYSQSKVEASIKALEGTGQFPKVQRSEEHTSELQSLRHLVCRLLLE